MYLSSYLRFSGSSNGSQLVIASSRKVVNPSEKLLYDPLEERMNSWLRDAQNAKNRIVEKVQTSEQTPPTVQELGRSLHAETVKRLKRLKRWFMFPSPILRSARRVRSSQSLIFRDRIQTLPQSLSTITLPLKRTFSNEKMSQSSEERSSAKLSSSRMTNSSITSGKRSPLSRRTSSKKASSHNGDKNIEQTQTSPKDIGFNNTPSIPVNSFHDQRSITYSEHSDDWGI